ncbi:MAG: Holliday junction branch migration protein RuvA, partial [Clostridia bacterium]|nr:Holliday junction branch migration protein RuvA [Clostridia bacterium]
DPKALTAATGVGIKLAQRIVLELKDKIGSLEGGEAIEIKSVGNATVNSNSKEAVAALVSLGYTQSEASLAVGRQDQSLSTEELIKQALKSLARGL